MAHKGSQPLVAVIVIGLLVTGCYGLPKQPPLPQADRIPTVVGQIIDREPDHATYHLAGDRIVVVGTRGAAASPSATLLSATDVTLPGLGTPGGLLLVGEDAAGTFYAATAAPANGCFLMRGEGYIDPGRIHLSSGLVLPKAESFEQDDQRGQGQDTWILSFDQICLDEAGRVTSVTQLGLGA